MNNKALAMLLVFGGVYWAPGLSPNSVFGLKVIALGLFGLTYKPKNKRVLRRIKVWPFLIIVPFFILASQTQGAELWKYTLGLLCGVMMLARKNTTNLESLKAVCRPLILAFCLLWIIVFFGNESNPLATTPFITSGFNTKSTGWSITLFQIVALHMWASRRHGVIFWGASLAFLVIQFMSGGRAATIATATLIFIHLPRRAKFALGLLVLAFVLQDVSNLETSVLAQWITRGNGYELNSISTNRWIQYSYLVSVEWHAYLFGMGLLGSQYFLSIHQGLPLEFHNQFIRLLLDHGVWALPLVFMIGRYLLMALKQVVFRKSPCFLSRFLFSSLPIWLLEPNFLIGAFLNSVVLWYFLALYNEKNADISDHNPALSHEVI